LSLAAQAGTSVRPTTTLARETGNNTSAAGSFVSQVNGNVGAGNVSKVPLRNLLYPGSSTRIYAHLMGWFGPSNHMNVGYNSATGTQVNAQVADMMSRGIDGAIIDWYGPNNTWPNQTTIYLRQAAEATNGKFMFAVMEDVGALNKCAATAGCDLNRQVISDLNYAYTNFENSAAYIRIGGRPVVLFFGLEKYSLDWNSIRAGVLGNPLFILRNSGAFRSLQSNGGFSWVSINRTNPDDIALSYLDNFYLTSLSYPSQQTFGTGFKGFNDTLAAWSANRIMNQDCGQTWLKTWAEAGRYYSSNAQLAQLQIATWNDYEEGTEIETGIDNCISVAGGMTGNTVTWSITGQENTIDHYTVFISLDGQNLMPVADVPAGTHSLALSSYGFGPASYTLYVKAVGKPTLTNKMSDGIPWTVANSAPVAKLSVTPAFGIAPMTISASTSGSSDPDGSIGSTAIDFGDGTVVNAATASHVYSAPGDYTLKATVTDNQGASSSATATVSVSAHAAPTVSLAVSPTSGGVPVTVSAVVNAAATGASISAVTINWGDGTTPSNGTRATHTYWKQGTFRVTVIATDSLGATGSTSATVNAGRILFRRLRAPVLRSFRRAY
jgi:PKD repeat protein